MYPPPPLPIRNMAGWSIITTSAKIGLNQQWYTYCKNGCCFPTYVLYFTT